jgi:MFS family permease
MLQFYIWIYFRSKASIMQSCRLLWLHVLLLGFVAQRCAGVVSDRIGRRLPILACLLGNAGFLVYTAFAPDVYQLFLARGLAGLFAGTQSVCGAYVSDLTNKAERPRELAHLQSAISVGFIAGPGMGIGIGAHSFTHRLLAPTHHSL